MAKHNEAKHNEIVAKVDRIFDFHQRADYRNEQKPGGGLPSSAKDDMLQFLKARNLGISGSELAKARSWSFEYIETLERLVVEAGEKF